MFSTKRRFLGAVIFSLCLVNLTMRLFPIDTTRELKVSVQRKSNVSGGDDKFLQQAFLLESARVPFHKIPYEDGKEPDPHSLNSFRRLSAECEWVPPVPVPEGVDESKTLIVGYPGSGKRLLWRMVEALTGYNVGDDFNTSENAVDSVIAVKTSYPHKNGDWNWGDEMDQSIMIIRNPQYAIESYSHLRYELGYSENVEQTMSRRALVYTMRAPVAEWITWRDEHFDEELAQWGYFIEFWMAGGTADVNCNLYTMSCTPTKVIGFEYLIDDSTDEINILHDAISITSTIIPEEGAKCMQEEVLARKEFYNANRDIQNPPNPTRDVYSYTDDQYASMVDELIRLITIYEGQEETENTAKLLKLLHLYLGDIPFPQLKGSDFDSQLGVMLTNRDRLTIGEGPSAYFSTMVGAFVTYHNVDFRTAGTVTKISVNFANMVGSNIVSFFLGDKNGEKIFEFTPVVTGGIYGEEKYTTTTVNLLPGVHVEGVNDLTVVASYFVMGWLELK